MGNLFIQRRQPLLDVGDLAHPYAQLQPGPGGSQPRGVVNCEAGLNVHRRAADDLLLRVSAKASGTSAHLVLSRRTADGLQPIGAADLGPGSASIDFRIGAAERLLFSGNAPVVVESLELLAP